MPSQNNPPLMLSFLFPATYNCVATNQNQQPINQMSKTETNQPASDVEVLTQSPRQSATETTLAQTEQKEFTRLDAIVKKGEEQAIAFIEALRLIRDQRLYRGQHNSFQDYCKTTLNYTRQYADYLLQAHDVKKGLTTIVVAHGLPPPAGCTARRRVCHPPQALHRPGKRSWLRLATCRCAPRYFRPLTVPLHLL